VAELRHVGLRAMKAAVSVADVPKLARLTLAALGNHANERGIATPSEALLALETSSGIRSVRESLGWLERAGVLRVTRRRAHLPNIYAIQVTVLDALPRVARPAPAAGLDPARPANHDSQTGKRLQPDRHPLPPNGVVNGSENGNPPVVPPSGGPSRDGSRRPGGAGRRRNSRRVNEQWVGVKPGVVTL
jgi:hypothetical protein